MTKEDQERMADLERQRDELVGILESLIANLEAGGLSAGALRRRLREVMDPSLKKRREAGLMPYRHNPELEAMPPANSDAQPI